MRSLILFLLVGLLISCSGPATSLKEEPVGIDDCPSYKLEEVRANCEAYLKAKNHLSKKEWTKARKQFELAEASETEFGKAFLAELNKKEKAAKLAAEEEARKNNLKAAQIDVKQVKEIQIIRDNFAFCPGQKGHLGLALLMKDGTVKKTWTDPQKKQGLVDYAIFQISSEVGVFSPPDFIPTKDISKIFNQGYYVKIALRENPEVELNYAYEPEYSCLEGIVFNGKNGTDGKASENGTNGEDGPEVTVEMGYVETTYQPKLLIARGTSTTGKVIWFAAPADNINKIKIATNGGNGGKGGEGGTGGNGGKGGKLSVFYEKHSGDIPDYLEVDVNGGKGGEPGGVDGEKGVRPNIRKYRTKKLFVGDDIKLLKH